MVPYQNHAGNSSVAAYDLGPGWIRVRFTSGSQRTYLYNAEHPGPEMVAEMQRLAVAGRGLSTYIATMVRDDYARKW